LFVSRLVALGAGIIAVWLEVFTFAKIANNGLEFEWAVLFVKMVFHVAVWTHWGVGVVRFLLILLFGG
jgi:hypothetical protein